MSGDKEPLHNSTGGGRGRHPHTGPTPTSSSGACNAHCCYKAFVVCYGLFFLFLGVILLSVAIWVETIRHDYSSINDVLRSPTIMAIVAGIVMICVSLIAIIGALKENLCMIKTFMAILIIVFILQVIIGIVAFVYKEESLRVASKQLRLAIREYHSNDKIAHGVDTIQTKWSCCGLDGPSDWDLNEQYACAADNSSVACSVPPSCCKDPQITDCGTNVRNETVSAEARNNRINRIGCTWYFYHWVESNLDTVGATALGFAILHVLGIFLVYMFITYVEDNENLFTYSKRSYQA